MSHKLSWDAARPITKGLGATLIVVAIFVMWAITPTRADTLTGCGPGCSDAFFLNGVPINGTITGENPLTGVDSQSVVTLAGITIVLDGFVVYLLTQEGTGTSETALVSDIVTSPFPDQLRYESDPFEQLDVASVEAFFGSLFKFQVLEETGSPQSLTAFNPNLTI
jgi:hypothetical protein